jgi:hypothetical protein
MTDQGCENDLIKLTEHLILRRSVLVVTGLPSNQVTLKELEHALTVILPHSKHYNGDRHTYEHQYCSSKCKHSTSIASAISALTRTLVSMTVPNQSGHPPYVLSPV